VSVYSDDERIRSLRPPKPYVDPFHAHGTVLEEERRPTGTLERTLTVFLAGAECAFACSFCDLWRWTIDGPTPPGALSTQLEHVLDALDGPSLDRLKLYNASNFFDPRAVPPADISGLARILEPFSAVTVESHASTIGRRAVAFARSIPGRLEVAMGLETIHPRSIAESNKRLDLPRFDRAITFLKDNGIDVRVFVLLGAPYVPTAESVEWTVRSVEYAVHRGADVVSIIPVRAGNGELERLQTLNHFNPPTLLQLEEALRESQRFTEAVVTADLWDVDRLPGCVECKAERVARLRVANITGWLAEGVRCSTCGDR
jgi:archaeosine synthase beta-subunit